MLLYGKNEHSITNNDNFYKLDLVDINSKKCIEINGDYWHANPEKYNEEDFINYRGKGRISVVDIWKKDEIKYNAIKEQGFELLVIWETDIKNDRQNVLQKCENFLNGVKQC
jgi:very-short-patch-repair endonuclease